MIIDEGGERSLELPLNQKNLLSVLGDSVGRRWVSLDGDVLCSEVKRRTGLDDFGDAAIEARVSVLTKAIESEANLHLLGRFLARMHLRDLLETRLRLVDAWKKSEPVDAAPIQHPIFITGMPRSGSTFLHELFVQDASSRAPLVWEVMHPPLKLETTTAEDQRQIKRTAACLWWFRQIAPRADAVHPMRATTPQECVAIHSYTLLSQEFLTIFHLPSYEAFLNSIDFSPAYIWQKRFLQHLQMGCPAKRWVLKAPDHIFSVDSLFKIFPDATVIQTHRDPIDVLKSSTQLGQVLRETFARPKEQSEVGEREARILAEGMERITRFRDSHPELSVRFFDVNYLQLISNPVETVRACYQQLDIPLTEQTLDRVRNLAMQRSRYPSHRPNSSLRDFGINVHTEGRRFANYCARFGIAQKAT